MDELFEIPLGEWADAFVDWLTAVFGGLFGLLGDGLRSLNDLVESGLTVAPWWLMIALLGLLALVARGWKLALGSVLGLLVIYGVGQWDNAMATLALVLVASLVAIVFGIPLGILGAMNATASRIMRPVLDLMQTMPAFVYLIPAVILFRVGVVPGIRKLTAEGIPVRLAVSLHAPSDALRDELVPMNKRFNTKQVLDAAHDYWLASKRRVSIEYALMRGINDQAEHAQLLAKRLNHYGDNWAHVNPIPLNPIEGSKWTASKPEDEQRFLEILHRAGITATLRDTRGQDIDGACGQLAAKER